MITAEDILAYSYCPILVKRNRKDIILPKSSNIDKCLIRAFISAEQEACLKDSIVTTRRLLAAWEKIWWPNVISSNIPIEEANNLSLKTSDKFSEYCRYDLSDWGYPTLGTNVENILQLESATISVHADVLKINLELGRPNLVIVNFSNRQLNNRLLSIDPYTLSTVYGFYSGKEDYVTYINLFASIDRPLAVTSCMYSKDDIERLDIWFKNISRNIHKKNYYYNPFLCKECKLCRDLQV